MVFRLWKDTQGQGTVEAAFALPILLLLMLLLIQPGIVLYDYIVMRNAAAETCRLAATLDLSRDLDQCLDFARNRLSAIPQNDLFHVHDGECSWYIQVDGGEQNGTAEVWIETDIKPLPLLASAFQLLGITDGAGCFTLGVNWSSVNQPRWVGQTGLVSPTEWVEQW